MAAVAFQVTQNATWLSSFYWWVPGGGDTSPQKFTLRQLTGALAGTIVSGATVTSGTLTAGQWNAIALASPVMLAAGIPYLAETAYTAVHGFAETKNQFDTGDPFVGGINSGPLSAYSDKISSGGTYQAPSGWISQGAFGTAFSDPTSGIPNLGSDSSSNFWIDVLITDSPPTSASYRLWPSLPVPPNTITDSSLDFTLATEFMLSGVCTLNNIWFYSPSGAVNLPTETGVYNQSSQTLVAGTHNSSPTWSGVAGSVWESYAYAWVTLAAGSYRVALASSNGTAGPWADATLNYFSSGAGGSGISAGPLTAPSESTADSPGQASYNAGASLAWPGTYNSPNAPCYWVDVEVTPTTASSVNAGAFMTFFQ